MKLRGSDLDLGRYRLGIPFFFLLGVLGTFELFVWSDRDEFAQNSVRTDGVISRITYFDRGGGAPACRLYLHFGDGNVETVLARLQTCDEVRPDRFVGKKFTVLRWRTGGQAEVVIGDEVIERYESARRIRNVLIGVFVWFPFLAVILNLAHYLYRHLKAAELYGKPDLK